MPDDITVIVSIVDGQVVDIVAPPEVTVITHVDGWFTLHHTDLTRPVEAEEWHPDDVIVALPIDQPCVLVAE